MSSWKLPSQNLLLALSLEMEDVGCVSSTMLSRPLHGTGHVKRLFCSLLQYIVAGTWRGMDVAIRVTKEKSMNKDGLHFLEQAINILKYVQCVDLGQTINSTILSMHFSIGSFSMKNFWSFMASALKNNQFSILSQNCWPMVQFILVILVFAM